MAPRKWTVIAQLGPEHQETWEIDLVKDFFYKEKYVAQLSDDVARQRVEKRGLEKAAALIDVWARPADEPEKHCAAPELSKDEFEAKYRQGYYDHAGPPPEEIRDER
jgi:uncharacterized protein YeaO (DUF488 family)